MTGPNAVCGILKHNAIDKSYFHVDSLTNELLCLKHACVIR